MFAKVFESVRATRRARAATEALAGLSDAALDDIGLTRAGAAVRPVPAERAAADRPLAQVFYPDFARGSAPARAQAA